MVSRTLSASHFGNSSISSSAPSNSKGPPMPLPLPFSLLPPLTICPAPKTHPRRSLYSKPSPHFFVSYRLSSGRNYEDDHGNDYGGGFNDAVALFNGGDYYKCHDVLEALWYGSQEPTRTLIHGILQCAVGFHHLFNQNHKGAMLELGEGLCKLRKMNFEGGPFLLFEQEISAVLEFIYQTQLELAACIDDFCLTIDQSDKSYQLLGSFAAGQNLYCLQTNPDKTIFIVFCPERSYKSGEPPRVKLPTLHASEEQLVLVECNGYY